MTERKPGTMSWETWTESQITRAEREGQFDNLPGSGKPIENLGENHEMTWLANKLRAEHVDPSIYLPPQLALAREVEDLAVKVRPMRSESDVREYLTGLNARIERLHARPPAGPPVRVKLVDADAVLDEWRQLRAADVPPTVVETPAVTPRRRRWFGRRVT